MTESKTPELLAAEITIAVVSSGNGTSPKQKDEICELYRAVYKEIKRCISTPASKLSELD